MIPPFLLGIGAKIIGLDFKKLLPAVPYVAAFGVGWLINGHRLDAGRIESELKAKDVAISQAETRAATASELAASKDAIVTEYKQLKDASERRVSDLEGRLVELSLKQPKDTTRIIDNTRDIADGLISKNSEFTWLHNTYPSVMLDNANKRIAASQYYGLPNSTLAGSADDWERP